VERSADTTRDDPDGEYLKRNRWFESGSLQRGVYCEPVTTVDRAEAARKQKHRPPTKSNQRILPLKIRHCGVRRHTRLIIPEPWRAGETAILSRSR
jgi:hypothetical protein